MKQKLFSVTKEDFDWQYFSAGGHGGQNVNKRKMACRCVHRASGAVGESREERHQIQNRRLAFSRCVRTPVFQNWIKLNAAAISKGFQDAEQEVDKMMDEKNIKVETYSP